jgi:methylamine--corrinoid protein Co-methyltransferase
MMDILDLCIRSSEGKPMGESNFDAMEVPMKLMELTKEHDVTYTPGDVIPTDKDVINSIYDAAIEFLVDIGFYNTSTNRIISFEEEELKAHLDALPGTLNTGLDNDTLHTVHRLPGDKKVPPVFGGPCGAGLSEEHFLSIMQSYAMEPRVEGVHTGTLLSINGLEVKAGTPLEMFAARRETSLTREALRRAGRPGMPIVGTMSAVTSEGQCFGHYSEGLRNSDMLLVSLLNDFKVDWDVLKKALYCQQSGLNIANCMCGTSGSMGDPAACAVGYAAECLASFPILGGNLINICSPFDMLTGHTILPECLYMGAAAIAAIAQNTKGLTSVYCPVSSGLCTESSMFEIAAVGGAATASGTDMLLGAPMLDALGEDNDAGMTARMLSEVAEGFSGMKMEEANELLKDIVKVYMPNGINGYTPEQGKKFYECYDMNTLKPSKEFEEMWHNSKSQLSDMGLNLNMI